MCARARWCAGSRILSTTGTDPQRAGVNGRSRRSPRQRAPARRRAAPGRSAAPGPRPRRLLRLREVAALVAETREALLLVERDRVVDLRADALLGEVLAQRVAALHPHHVLVVGVAAARELLGQPDLATQARAGRRARGSGRRRPVALAIQPASRGSLARRIAACSASSRKLPPTKWCTYLGLMPCTRMSTSFSASASSFVVTRPPSPNAPRFLVGKKEKHPKAPRPPTGTPLYSVPIAWQQSSTSGMAPATSRIASMSAACPYRCTGMIALVRGVIAAASCAGRG